MDTAALSSICNGFAHSEECPDGTFRCVKNDYCLDNLKDLQRLLRRDDPVGRGVFKQVCRWNVVGRDLVPLIESHQNDSNLVINVVKVLVFLTMPVDPTSDDIPQQVDYLWQLKSALARDVAISVIVSLIEDPLEHLESSTFTEDDWKLVQLVLTLFRNLLAIQDILSWQSMSGYSTEYLQLREHFLELLFNASVMDLILVLVQHINDANGYLRHDNLLLLEILHYIWWGQDPELLAKALNKNFEAAEDLLPIVDEKEEKSRPRRPGPLGCGSNFNGMFTCLTIDGNKTVFKGNPTTVANFVAFEKDENKKAKGKPSSIANNHLTKARQVQRGPMKKIAWDSRNLSMPKKHVLKLLSDFLNNFLAGAYNGLMQSVLEDVEKEHDTVQGGDITTFFQAACFVIAFQRHKFIDFKKDGSPGDICSPVAATLNERMLFLVISKWREAFDSLKQTHDYKALSSAGSLMKNMIRMLDLVLKLLPDYSCEAKTARVLLYKLFYDQTTEGFTQFLLNQIKSFDTQKQARSDLADLVEILHVTLRLMENLQQHGALRVSRKSSKGRKKKPSTSIAENEIIPGESIHVVGGNEANGESFQSNDRGGVHLNLTVKDPAAQIFNDAAENQYPEQMLDSDFGYDHHGKGISQTIDEKTSHDLAYETDASSNDEYQSVTNEVDFNVSKLVSEFASSSAIQNICWLLKFCKSNPPSTNHYIICMMHRICDLELSPLLYQLSFLVIFYDILSDEKMSKKCPDVVYFLTKLMRCMMKKIRCQPLLFVDILFLKTRKECHIINSEGIEHELSNVKHKIDGIYGGGNCSTKGFGPSTCQNLADALGEDEFPLNLDNDMEVPSMDDLQDHLDEPTKPGNSERYISSIARNLQGDDLNADKISGDEHHQGDLTRQKKLVFSTEEDTLIRELYERFKDERRCSHLIAKALDLKRKISPVQVSRKLKQLGLQVVRRQNHRGQSFRTSTKTVMEDGKLAGDATSSSPLRLEETALRSTYRRKRTKAFSEDQEALIRRLFEQFKDSKRCSHLIANALDSNCTYSASQVTRKLKQLGLLLPRQKAINNNNLSSPVGLSEKENSDEETLLTMMNRTKKRKILNENSSNNSIGIQHHGSPFDSEPLNSLLRNGETNPTEGKASECAPIRTNHKLATEVHNHADRATGHHLFIPDEHGADEGAIAELALLNDDIEDEINNDASEEQIEGPVAPGFASDNIPSILGMHELEKGDELVDSEDDLGSTTTLKRTGIRRKLMIDAEFEDDD